MPCPPQNVRTLTCSRPCAACRSRYTAPVAPSSKQSGPSSWPVAERRLCVLQTQHAGHVHPCGLGVEPFGGCRTRPCAQLSGFLVKCMAWYCYAAANLPIAEGTLGVAHATAHVGYSHMRMEPRLGYPDTAERRMGGLNNFYKKMLKVQ